MLPCRDEFGWIFWSAMALFAALLCWSIILLRCRWRDGLLVGGCWNLFVFFCIVGVFSNPLSSFLLLLMSYGHPWSLLLLFRLPHFCPCWCDGPWLWCWPMVLLHLCSFALVDSGRVALWRNDVKKYWWVAFCSFVWTLLFFSASMDRR